MKRLIKGFTLVELMITLAVLSILVTIGYPLYNVQLQKSRRIDARGTLSKLAMVQERYYAMFGNYATTTAQLNFGPDGVEDGVNDIFAYNEVINSVDYDQDGVADHYSFALNTDGDATTEDYIFTARAADVQLADTDCVTFTIDQLGRKTAEDDAGNDESERCW
ncbi:MAG: type IV pilin protein [Chromatiales bacterium]|jgi:type IV pilus assembly protein PilE